MTLPFSLDQFLDVFAAYNRLLWPGALLLWIVGVVALVLFLRRDHRATKVMGWTLVAQWVWSGAAYHLAFFRAINPMAVAFGALFLVQAGLLAWWTLRATPTAFPRPTSMWGRIGVVLIGYALAYPLLGVALGLDYPRMPTFGVPCPTTLFTVGALLVARETAPRWLGVIPLAWTAVGGSAAFLFGVHADLALPIAGTVLLMSMVLPRGRTNALAALAAFAAMFTADARSYPPGAPAAIGLPAIHDLTVEYLKAGITDFRETTTDFYGNAEYVIDAGDYVLTYGGVTERGKYLNVWKWVDGGWRIQSNTWNADAPAVGTVPP